CVLTLPRPDISTFFPYTTLFRSCPYRAPYALPGQAEKPRIAPREGTDGLSGDRAPCGAAARARRAARGDGRPPSGEHGREPGLEDRKSTRLNSSHVKISYADFCL